MKALRYRVLEAKEKIQAVLHRTYHKRITDERRKVDSHFGHHEHRELPTAAP
jgi:hypothetical protein